MNKYVKEFIHRGLVFGGFGPMVMGIVYAIISACGVNVVLNANEVLLAIVSSYLLAFVQAGVSVFNQIEHWPLMKSLFWHFILLFVSYSGCYLVNSWIPLNLNVIAIFAGIFVVCYAVIWVAVYLSVKAVSRRLNAKL